MNDNLEEAYSQFAVYGTTNLHPIAAVFMLCMAGLVMFGSRSRAILGVLLVCVFMPAMQRIVVGGLDFSMIRIIMLVAWARVLARQEYRGFSPGRFDLLFVLWTASLATIFVLRTGNVVNRLGASFDALTLFFIFRVLLRRREEVFTLVRQLAVITIVLGVFLAYEMATRHNVFHIFGSAPRLSVIRNAKVRAMGPFSHPIMSGTFGAGLVPLFIAALRGTKKSRKRFGFAIAFAIVIAVASGSTGPLITLMVGLVGWGLWPLRRQMRAILGAGVVMALFVHVIREKPIWHLIGRLGSVAGGTGWHRYRLIDAFINNFGQWALLGISDTASWGWGLQDTTNYYIRQGTYGGFLTFVMFLVLLGSSFSRLRRIRFATERAEGPKSLWTQLCWGFSVVLAAHCVSFISTSYFGQMEFFLFILFAMIPSLARFRRPAGVPAGPRQSARPVPQASPA